MNDFSYQAMAKEKIANLQKEGIRSQSFYRSGVPKLDLLRGLPKLIPIILGSLGILALLVR